MRNNKVAVIIPVKNEQTKIIEAIQSIVFNNEADISLIIVDDASEDQTVNNVRNLFSEKGINGDIIQNTYSQGAGECRNIGLKHLPEVDYVYFFDADDILCPGALDLLVYNAELYGSDVVIGKYIYIDEKKKYKNEMISKDERLWLEILKGSQLTTFNITQNCLFLETVNYPWNKLLSYDFVKDINLHFSTTIVNNDILAHWLILMSSYQVTLVDSIICEHRVYDSNPQITNISDIRRFSLFEALNDVECLFDQNPHWKNAFYPYFLRFKLDLAEWSYCRIDASLKTAFMEAFRTSLKLFDYQTFLLVSNCFPEIAIEYAYLKYGMKEFK